MADWESIQRFSGHGSAIAQAYNHMILPLANRRDKITQIEWGLRDFAERFRRDAEGMWLPETAVDLETLDLMAERGVRFTILAPHQALRIRRADGGEWREVPNATVDITRAYEVDLPSGRKIAVFFYHGPISRAISFEGLLGSGDAFAKRLMDAFPAGNSDPQLVHVATDGESYGHHHRFGDMALAYALDKVESGGQAALTNYGEFLDEVPAAVEGGDRPRTHPGVARTASNAGGRIAAAIPGSIPTGTRPGALPCAGRSTPCATNWRRCMKPRPPNTSANPGKRVTGISGSSWTARPRR